MSASPKSLTIRWDDSSSGYRPVAVYLDSTRVSSEEDLQDPQEGLDAARETLADRHRMFLGVARERDEAREVLRELVDRVRGTQDRGWGFLVAAVAHAERVLEGVERTHALVPIAVLEQIAGTLDGGPELELGDYIDAMNAAARGEHAEWPS